MNTTPREVLASLSVGLGDPLSVSPAHMHTNVQRAILSVFVQRGAGVSFVRIKEELAGHQDADLVAEEVRCVAMGDHALTEDAFNALNQRLRREHLTSMLRKDALEVVRRINEEGATPEQLGPHIRGMAEHTAPEVGDEVESIGSNTHELFLGTDEAFVPIGLRCMEDLRVSPGALCVLAARPGGGKTALLGTWALNAARSGWRVLFLSLEMPSRQIRQRILSGMSGVPLYRVMRPEGTELVQHINEMAALPIGIRDAVAGDTLTVERIAALVRAHKARHPDEKLAVFVDYIQLIQSREKYQIRHELLGHICRSLKACALREQVPIIAAAQVGRQAEQRGKDSRPQLSDLRESGEIENTADQVVLVHREAMSDKALIAVAKYRMGAPFLAEARFDGERCLFTDAEASGIVREDWQ